MDSGLFWSAPAKRRGRIEPQRWGIGTWTLASTRAAATALSPHRKAWFGTGEAPHPKRRRASGPSQSRDDLGSHGFR